MIFFFQGLKKGLQSFGELIFFLVSTIFLFFIYIFILGFTVFLGVVLKKEFLELRRGEWSAIEKRKEKDYFSRQF